MEEAGRAENAVAMNFDSTSSLYAMMEVESGSEYRSVGLVRFYGTVGINGEICSNLDQAVCTYLQDHELRPGVYRVCGALFEYSDRGLTRR